MIEGKEIYVSAGAVATEAPEAARIGARIIEAGGNAMDAAAAACLATAVLVPYYSDLGGYVCSGTVLEGRSGEVWSLDSNSTAPAAAHGAMFTILPREPGKVGINETEYACSVHGDANVYGPLAVGVPGFMAGVGILWEKWGRLTWPEIIAPSQALIETGFRYDAVAPAVEKRISIIRRFEPTCRLLMPEDRLPKPDDLWHRPGLEKTLTRLAAAGWRDFYQGEIGRRLADYLAGVGGILSREDLAGFEPRLSRPLETSFRKARIFGPVLPNGALSVLQILNMLDGFDPLPLEDVFYWHRLAEILKLAWGDRLRCLADPAFSEVPEAKLLSKDYAAERTKAFRNSPSSVARSASPRPGASRHGTAHVSAADAQGNLVSVTLSQGNPFGSCVAVPGTGFILAHGMCRFDPRPGRPNSVGPRKRPLNNVCPLIVRASGRDIALGMRGGRRIVSVVAEMAQRLVDLGLTTLEAAHSPRIHTLEDEPVEVEASCDLPFVKALAGMGHDIRRVEDLDGTAHGAEILKAARGVRAGGSIGAAGA